MKIVLPSDDPSKRRWRQPGAGGGSSGVRYPAQSEASEGLRGKFQTLVSYSLVPVMLVGTIPLYTGLRTLFSPEVSLILTATINMLVIIFVELVVPQRFRARGLGEGCADEQSRADKLRFLGDCEKRVC